MVKIIYITRINFFSGRANIHTIAKTCEALSQIEDINIDLVSTDNSLLYQEEKDIFFNEHNVSHKFSIISLNSFSNRYKTSHNFFDYSLGIFFGNISLIKYAWFQRKNFDVFYFRDHLILPVALFAKFFLRKKLIYECHYILTKKIGQWLTEKSVSASDGVVAIAKALRAYYLRFNKNIIVSFCASSDKDKFATDHDKYHFRELLGLEKEKYYLVYTGNLDVTGNGDSYGVEDIVDALPYMPEDVVFVAVGKKTQNEHWLEKKASALGVKDKFICVDWQPREKVTEYVLAADCLIIPKSGAKAGNSPTKMFEYLATSRPIVAANTEAIAEVLHDEENALLVDYRKPRAWAQAVGRIIEDPALCCKLTDQAALDAELYTWPKRGEDIGNFIKKNA